MNNLQELLEELFDNDEVRIIFYPHPVPEEACCTSAYTSVEPVDPWTPVYPPPPPTKPKK